MLSIRKLIRSPVVCKKVLAGGILRFHGFSTSSAGDDGGEKAQGWMSRPTILNAGMIGGGAVVLYGLSALAMDVAYSFMTLTPAVTAYYGFWAGNMTMGLVSTFVVSGYRATAINPHRVFKSALGLVNHNTSIREVLGGKL